MEHYVGLDVSLKLTSICVVNQTRSIVQEGVVDSDPEAIASFVRLKAPACPTLSRLTHNVILPPSIGALRKVHSITSLAMAKRLSRNIRPSAFALLD
jgi:hypothetical protein